MMKIIKYIPYTFLVLAVLFVFDGVENLNANNQGKAILSFLFGAGAVFMFFFRRRFAKKMEDRHKNQE